MNIDIKREYDARWKRVEDATKLVEPDRVPLVPLIQAFPMYYSGITIKEAMHEHEKAGAAFDAFYNDFKPDLAWDPILMVPARYLKAIDIRWFRWPGNGIDDPNQMYQFIEDEYMKEDEYDEFIYDPTNFMQTKWIPRCFGALTGMKQILLRSSMWFGFFGTFAPFGNTEVQRTFQALADASGYLNEWYGFLGNYRQNMKEKFGLPLAYGSFGFTPFDMLGDTLRGTIPILQDMYDRPEKLLLALEKMLPIALESSIPGAKASGNPYVWIFLHKGVDEFMSDEFYKKFYWPTFQKYLNGLIEAGLNPFVYVEGNYNTRLEILRDVPKGKVIYDFETVDMAKAKKVLGDVACIAGNVPNYLLAHGSAQEVEDYCKYLIDTCAPGGGFMMDASALIDNAKTENIERMFEITQSYGTY